ncbi:MAG: DUF134 domain-containing protein [Desulfurococcales archaeon]|nr:DUF134 domain-containing protein [Desulfurococcales archaeon]
MPGWMWRWRRGGPGRPPKPRVIAPDSAAWGVVFEPFTMDGRPYPGGEPVVLSPDEVEALRLVYLEGLTQGEAAERMGVSRGTLWRILREARRKVALALVEGRPIVVEHPGRGA